MLRPSVCPILLLFTSLSTLYGTPVLMDHCISTAQGVSNTMISSDQSVSCPTQYNGPEAQFEVLSDGYRLTSDGIGRGNINVNFNFDIPVNMVAGMNKVFQWDNIQVDDGNSLTVGISLYADNSLIKSVEGGIFRSGFKEDKSSYSFIVPQATNYRVNFFGVGGLRYFTSNIFTFSLTDQPSTNVPEPRYTLIFIALLLLLKHRKPPFKGRLPMLSIRSVLITIGNSHMLLRRICIHRQKTSL